MVGRILGMAGKALAKKFLSKSYKKQNKRLGAAVDKLFTDFKIKPRNYRALYNRINKDSLKSRAKKACLT